MILFNRHDVSAGFDRLTFVKTAQQLGFSVYEISALLRLEDGTLGITSNVRFATIPTTK
ncbi:MAG: MerR family DNA-binding protein [Acidiferrobacterales bacterium]|nr:MerR family DNA-binding protein [Acidiferrobacterales bacterium]